MNDVQRKFTYHIVYIKLKILTAFYAGFFLFTYHIVYIKLNSNDKQYTRNILFTYHIVYIKQMWEH